MSGPMRKVISLFLLELSAALCVRLFTHAWPPVFLLGIVGGGAFYVWHKEKALDERVRLYDLGEKAAQRGKYGARHYRL
jgi:hypothetical protein